MKYLPLLTPNATDRLLPVPCLWHGLPARDPLPSRTQQPPIAPRHLIPQSLAPFLLSLLLALVTPTHAQPTTAPAPDLPILSLNAANPIVFEQRVPCTLKLQLPAGTPTTQPLKATVKLRGSTSLTYPKKSFAVALDAPASLVGLREHQHWILNAAYIDRSLMRHKLSYDLFRSLSTPQQPRYAVASRFVELNLNDRYNGLYLLMERLDDTLVHLQPFAASDKDHAVLYKAVNHDASFHVANHNGFEQIHPDPTALAYWQPLDDFLRFIVTSKPEPFRSAIASRLDLDNAIDFHLLVLVTANADGITKNYYLARSRPRPDAPARFFFVPWDYDGTFGRNWDARPLPHQIWLSNALFDRLLQDPAYRQRFVARWRELRDHQFSVATLHAMIDANARQIAAAIQRNQKRWPTDRAPYPDRITFDQEIAQMKTWIAARIPWLDTHIQRLAR